MHNISSSCTKPSLTGLFSRVHSSDEKQLTHLKCCTHVNKHLVNNVWKNNFITDTLFQCYPIWLSALFGDTRYYWSHHTASLIIIYVWAISILWAWQWQSFPLNRTLFNFLYSVIDIFHLEILCFTYCT